MGALRQWAAKLQKRPFLPPVAGAEGSAKRLGVRAQVGVAGAETVPLALAHGGVFNHHF